MTIQNDNFFPLSIKMPEFQRQIDRLPSFDPPSDDKNISIKVLNIYTKIVKDSFATIVQEYRKHRLPLAALLAGLAVAIPAFICRFTPLMILGSIIILVSLIRHMIVQSSISNKTQSTKETLIEIGRSFLKTLDRKIEALKDKIDHPEFNIDKEIASLRFLHYYDQFNDFLNHDRYKIYGNAAFTENKDLYALQRGFKEQASPLKSLLCKLNQFRKFTLEQGIVEKDRQDILNMIISEVKVIMTRIQSTKEQITNEVAYLEQTVNGYANLSS